jgi:thymidine phosphorylase
VVQLGGGRLKQDDRLDLAVGLSDIARIGEEVDGGTPLLRIHAASEEAARAVAGPMRAAFTLSDARSRPPDLIHERIG